MSDVELTIILGPPGSGKAGRAIDVLRDAAAEGRDAFLCVPGAVDRARFLRELGGAAGGVLVGVEVGTFDQLVARVAGSPPVRRTDRAMERIVVRDALRDVPAFAAASRWSGFVDTARARVDRLRRARVWGGEELEQVERQLPGEHVGQWRRLEQRVGELLDERRLRDDAWFERRAARRIRSGEPGVDAVVCYGFDALAPGRRELLERLARVVPVTVTLAWRPGRRVHERAADLRDRWRRLGAFIEELPAAPVAEPLLDWLGSELFEDAPAARPRRDGSTDGAPAAVAFVDCCGPSQEAEEVVREVALLRSRGFAWDDIVVASADATAGDELLLAAFRRAAIPVRLQARRRAVDVPVGRALHELLDSLEARDALRLVAALRAPLFGVARERVDAAELRLRGDRHGPRTSLEAATVRRVLPRSVADLVDLEPRDPRSVDAVRSLLASLHPADLGELDLLRGIAALVEGLVVAAGDEQGVSVADVRDSLATFSLATPDRSDSGGVVIASLEDLRSVAWDCVVLHGMHLAGFRARTDDEAEQPAAGRDLLHLAVTRARRTIRVVRQATGSNGGELAPSPAWQELRRLLPDAPLRVRRLGAVVVEPDSVRLASERPVAVAAARGAGVDVDGVEPGTEAQLAVHLRRRRVPRVTGPVAEALEARTTLGVTELESYATCSARWFIERQLRDRDPDDDRTRILDGLLAHDLLQHLVPAAHAGSIDHGELRTRALELAPELVAKLDDADALHPSRVERIVDHVVALVESERDWARPDSIETERSFGSDRPDAVAPGYVVDGVELVGRIDRIDRHGSRVVLHDYKYSATPRPASSLLEDRNLQLLVYWLALRQPGSPLEPVAALYRAITDGGSASGVLGDPLKQLGVVSARKRTMDDDACERLLAEAEEVVHAAVRDLRRGVVQPLADPAACPAHCRLQLVCRVGEATEVTA